MVRVILLFVLLSAILSTLSGCAMFNRENTKALNFVESHIVPSDPLVAKATYPLTIPVSIVAVTFDAFLFHPLAVVPDAVDDMQEWAWDNMDWENHYFSTSASVVPRAAFTPLAFTGSFLGRSMFDVSGPPSHPKETAEYERQVQEARKALTEQRSEDALVLAQKVLKKVPFHADALEIRAAVLLDKGEIRQLVSQRMSVRWSSEIERRYIRALVTSSPEDRVRLMVMIERGMFYSVRPSDELVQTLSVVLRDEDRAVGMKALSLLGNYMALPSCRKVLEEVASKGDPVLAAEAQMRLPMDSGKR